MDCVAEIRNTIYGYVLGFDHRLVRRSTLKDPYALALLRVSKGIECEAAPIFYEVNRFHFSFDPSEAGDLSRNVPLQARENEHSSWIGAVPERYVSSLRNVSLVKLLPHYWPNGPVLNSSRGEDDLGLLECEQMINELASRNTILNVLSITLRRQAIVNHVDYDENPLVLLSELDKNNRISAAVGKLSNLKRMEIWKSRAVCQSMWTPKVATEWIQVRSSTFEQIKLSFPQAKSVLYSRRLEGEPSQKNRWYFAEGHLIDFAGWGTELKGTTDTKHDPTLELNNRYESDS